MIKRPRESDRPGYGIAGTLYGGTFQVEDYALTSVPLNEYFWDRMETAYEAMRQVGTLPGFNQTLFQALEGEYETRRRSTTLRQADNLQIEFVEAEIGVEPTALANYVAEICGRISRDLGWDGSMDALVTFSAVENQTAWAYGPFGYCADKFPYDKVVLPAGIAHNSSHLETTLRHEYAHVVTLNSSKGRAPRWLSEAVSQTASGEAHTGPVRALALGQAPWLRVGDLEAAFSGSVRIHGTPESLQLAYAQALVVGQFLATQGGLAKLGELLRAHADESLFHNLELGVLGRSRTDGAMGRVYGMSEEAALEQAGEWIKGKVVRPLS